MTVFSSREALLRVKNIKMNNKAGKIGAAGAWVNARNQIYNTPQELASICSHPDGVVFMTKDGYNLYVSH